MSTKQRKARNDALEKAGKGDRMSVGNAIGDAAGSMAKKAGWKLVAGIFIGVILVGLLGQNVWLQVKVSNLVERGTADRFTGTRWENEKTLLDIRMTGLHEATEDNTEAIGDNAAEVEKLRKFVEAEVAGIHASMRDAAAKATESLIQQVQIRQALEQLIVRSDEDRKAQAEYRKSMQALAERIVKIESWRSGPQKDK